MTWDPDINNACAVSRDSFAISIGKLELDDPFSCILTYDGSLAQPWSRIDIAREINSLVASHANPDHSYIACSDEGDVYYIGEQITREKIPNSGLHSTPHAQGMIFGLSQAKNVLFAVGDNDQILKMTREVGWERLPSTGASNDDFDAPAYARIEAFDDGTVYAAGSVRAKSKSVNFLEIEEWPEM